MVHMGLVMASCSSSSTRVIIRIHLPSDSVVVRIPLASTRKRLSLLKHVVERLHPWMASLLLLWHWGDLLLSLQDAISTCIRSSDD